MQTLTHEEMLAMARDDAGQDDTFGTPVVPHVLRSIALCLIIQAEVLLEVKKDHLFLIDKLKKEEESGK
jgi:hypothetical protein